MPRFATRAQRKNTRLAERLQTSGERLVRHNRRKLSVIESRTLQAWLVELKTQWFNKVQLYTGVGAQPNDVAGIGWDLRLEKNKAKHSG